MQTSKKIMILGASILQLPAIEKAIKMGHSVVAVDMNPDAIGFKVDGVITEIISTIDIPKVVEAAKKHNVDGIMTLASDMPIRTVAAVSKELGLVGLDMDTAIKATNKAEMRIALRNYGVPIPEFYRVSSFEEYRIVVRNFCNEFIVKPADNSGSRGICKVTDITDQNLINETYEYSKASSRSGDVVVEEYMSGPEVSVETLTIDGECHVIQITDKITTGAPHFVEMGHSQPTRLSKDVTERICQITKDANKAIGIMNGPSHTEIIVTKDGPKIVELGARLGGDCITTHLVPFSTGVDMVESCIKIALGEKPSVVPKFSKASAIRYFESKKGILKNIENIDEAKNIDGVKQISFVYKVGEKIDDIRSSVDRIGFVISQAENVETAINSCEKAIEKIKIEIL